MGETWQIPHAGGVMRAEVSQTVAIGHLAALSEWHGWRAARMGDGPRLAAAEAMGDSAREAVARLAVGNGLALVEILAPGELTRAEAIAAARHDGAESMRAAILAALHQSLSGDQLRAIRAAEIDGGAR